MSLLGRSATEAFGHVMMTRGVQEDCVPHCKGLTTGLVCWASSWLGRAVGCFTGRAPSMMGWPGYQDRRHTHPCHQAVGPAPNLMSAQLATPPQVQPCALTRQQIPQQVKLLGLEFLGGGGVRKQTLLGLAGVGAAAAQHRQGSSFRPHAAGLVRLVLQDSRPVDSQRAGR